MRGASLLAAVVWLVGCSRSSGGGAAPDAGQTVEIQLVSLSTWLGQLDPVSVTGADGGTQQLGGLPALSAYFAQDRAANPNTVLLMSGDSFGADPPLASQFNDEPAVKALDFLGASADMLGNHNFDQGIPYLQNLIGLSTYPYVSTNMSDVQTVVSSSVVVPYTLVSVGGVQVGVLGITSQDAPNHTTPGNFGAITIQEPTAAATAAAAQARMAGAQVVVALTDLETTGVGIAGTHTGPLMDFANAVTGVDVVLGYNQNSPGTPLAGTTLVVEHVWKGMTYGRTHVTLSGGAVVSTSAEVVTPDDSLVTPDPAAEALLAPYQMQLDARFDMKVSVASATFALDGSERVEESALGDLVADSMLAKYASGGAQIAVMNGAGLRDSIPSSYAPGDMTLRRPMSGYAPGPPWDVVVGDPYTVLPFGDFCVVRPVTAAVLWQTLEQSVFQIPASTDGFLQIAGFTFTYSASAAPGARVQSVTLDDGTSLSRADTQTSVMLVDNDYIDHGGDDYGMLIQDPPAPTRDVDAEVLLQYLQANPTLTPGTSKRITQLP